MVDDREKMMRTLGRSTLFAGVPPKHLEFLAGAAELRTFAFGEMIFSEGERADGLFVVASGSVKVYKVAPDAREQILHVIGPGDSFGDAAVFAGGTFPAHAAALKRSTVVAVDGGSLLDAIEAHPELAVEIIASLSTKLREFAQMIEALSLHDVASRLAKFLLDESARTGESTVTLATSKAALAASIGTVAETLSRTLQKLSRKGVIRVDGPRIEIVDAAALGRVSAGLSSP